MPTLARTPWPDLKRGLVAILRGIKPEEIAAIGDELVAAGFEAIEIPLNSPEPFQSIETLAKRVPANVLAGAGTVLRPSDVKRLNDAGGRLLVTPNVDPDVIMTASAFGMVSMPGVFTATEALLAIKSGASALKFFPASAIGPNGVNAIKAVLPKEYCGRSGRRRGGCGFCQLDENRRQDFRPRLQPLQAGRNGRRGWHSRQTGRRSIRRGPERWLKWAFRFSPTNSAISAKVRRLTRAPARSTGSISSAESCMACTLKPGARAKSACRKWALPFLLSMTTGN